MHSSSLSMEERKLFTIANRVFHVSYFLKICVMSFKYGLILLRYSSADRVLFLVSLLLYCYSKNYLPLLVYNNCLFLHVKKDS